MKKFFMALCACALIGANVTVHAAEETAPDNVYVWGQVEEVSEDQIHITNSSDTNNDIILNVSDSTIIMDAVSGEVVDIEEVDENETIYGYVSPVMTRSLPPMTNAFVIFVNLPEDARAPKYVRVGEMLEAEDGTVRFLDSNGSLIATLDENTEFSGPANVNMLADLDMIEEGRELVLWYDVELLSYPGQAYIPRAVLLPEKQDGWVQEGDDWYYYTNGTMNTNMWVSSTATRWYYVGEDGKMVTNTVVDGCQINEKGIYEAK